MSKKLTFEEFISKAKLVHGDKYKYPKQEYKNSSTKVRIFCKKHGIFEQLPSNHLAGQNCPMCAGGIKLTKEEFIKKSKEVHGDKYDYSLVEYKNTHTKVDIICNKHGIFKQEPASHLSQVAGCPKCSQEKAANSLRSTTEIFIKKAKKIHGDKYDYSLVKYINSYTKIKIICKEHGEFLQLPNNHIKKTKPTKCPKCTGNKKYTFQDFVKKAKETHKNKYEYPEQVYKNSTSKIKIVCQIHGIFLQSPIAHLKGNGCPKCKGYGQTTEEFIQKAKVIHRDKYDYSLVKYVNATTKIEIICKLHGIFKQLPNTHLKFGCPKCVGRNKTTVEFIEDAKKIHGNKFDYSLVNYKDSKTKVTIICKEHGCYEQVPSSHLAGVGCPWCGGKLMDNSFFIDKSSKKHNNKYDYSLVKYVKSTEKVKIICPIHGIFEQIPSSHLMGAGCPICNIGFTKSYKIQLLNSLENSDLLTMDPIELSIIIGQGNLPIDFRPLVNTEALSGERIATLKELRDRIEGEMEDGTNENQTTEQSTGEANQTSDEEGSSIEIDDVDVEITSTQIKEDPKLPRINPIADLRSLDNSLYATMDEEAINSLIQYKLRKFWNIVLNDTSYVKKLRKEKGGNYFTTVKKMFLKEYDIVSNYIVPRGYSFEHAPNLMQKLTVHRLLKNKSYGNWSGTGAGKTLSFIIASREIDARLTVVVALNSTIKQMSKAIKSVYPDSLVFTEYKNNFVFDRNKHNYLVLNYEKFQQEKSEEKFQSLTSNNKIDFVVIDEVHNSKQRDDNEESIRRGVLTRLIGRIREKNVDLHTLVMSATPVINNLFEAKSLLTLMTGLEYEDLKTRKNLPNALKIFTQLTLNGLRFIPKYNININELTGQNMTNLSTTANHLLDNLLDISPGNYVDVEKMLLEEKLRMITPYIRRGVVIYTYFTTDIVKKIEDFVESLGFSVGTYTGEESTHLREQNLNNFIDGNLDVLIGSKPIGTGVDGLQDVCNRMIIITLPWTDSEYTQLKGRIYRQGSLFNNVEIIIPQVKIETDQNEVWSWDIQRLNLIKNKKTLADAAVDGVIPSKIIPRPSTMLKKSQESLKKWKERVGNGQIIENNRNPLQINLYPEISDISERERRINSELSEFNRRGKTLHSTTMHNEFTDNPDSWHRYHALRKSRMETWEEIPYEYIATKISDTRDVVADFGCGENLFRNCIPNNRVYSFDHVAIDESVIACDMRNTGLENEIIDVAVFSLALWGTNYAEYITEANRIMKRRGLIYIAEPSKNYETPEEQEKLIAILKENGFQLLGNIENRGKFIYITAIKIESV